MWRNGLTGGVRADFSRADFSEAVLRGAVLRGADFRGAVLRGADFSRAKYLSHDGKEKIIKLATGWSNLYKYWVFAVQFEDNTQRIRMGCHYRSVEDWDSDFWNNQNEFPNDNSEESLMRLNAYNFAKQWLKIKAGTP
jgi:hypothetical protein